MGNKLSDEIINFISSKVNDLDLFRKPLVGFSAANDPLYKNIKKIVGEHHLEPSEFLPEVKTVISFFIPLSEKVIKANKSKLNDTNPERWSMAHDAAARLINELSSDLALFLKERNFKALAITDKHNSVKNLKAAWSHRSSAFVANLGSFGFNRLLITSKGVAGRYGTVLVSAKIPIVQKTLQEEYCLFLKYGSCRYCFSHCPSGAIGSKLGDFDRQKCYQYQLGLATKDDRIQTGLACGKCSVGPCAIF